MNGKVIMLMVDAMSYDACVEVAGAVEGWVESGEARRQKMRSVLPSLSMPAYESLHTGTTPQVHGILSNNQHEVSRGPHVFGLAHEAGKKTAVVAHSYFSELLVRAPYDAVRDCEVDDESHHIQHGRFYSEFGETKYNACLPGTFDICARGTHLIERFGSDYLFLHAVGPDHVGHVKGGDSAEYRYEIWQVSDALSLFVPRWRAMGYRVLVTGDHGMADVGHHGGTTDQERYVPFWDIGHPRGGIADGIADQTSVATTILDILGVEPAPIMKGPSLAH